MPPQVTAQENRASSAATASPRAGKQKKTLQHDLGNELAVISGFVGLALTSLRQLREKLEGDVQSELQSIISMVERIKTSAEQGRNLLFPSASMKSESEPTSVTKHRIMVIDASLPLLALVNKILAPAGYVVETFADSAIALRRFAETPDAFDVVITDEIMSDRTAEILAEKIRTMRPDIPVVLCTGAGSSGASDRCHWAQAVIPKPFQPNDLSSLIGRVIAEAKKAQSHT
jgi:CheY-like chemotaxis protein